MKKGMIITLPRYDDTTEYISQWSYEIEDAGDKAGIGIKQLRDKDVNRKEFEKIVAKLNYKLIILNGHGSETSIFGHDDKVLIQEGANHEILTDRITYSRSCNSAFSLGVACMKSNKEGCFIGYNVEFTFYIDNNWAANPRKDKTAGLFLSSSNLVPISIIKGNSGYEAHERAKRQMLKNINKVLKEKTKDSLLIASTLWNNYLGQVILGNQEATL
ncbi:hypothetical protein HYT23_04750 [Candidatus Pacearchaeota archaeon]|nr:hypothetical protein [Candidatus Pacearchaeota archaeon]